MISKQQALDYNTQEAEMLRYIDSELLKYRGQIIEFSVERYPQELLDKWITVYQAAGWEIKQKNRRNNHGWRESYGELKRHWRVK